GTSVAAADQNPNAGAIEDLDDSDEPEDDAADAHEHEHEHEEAAEPQPAKAEAPPPPPAEPGRRPSPERPPSSFFSWTPREPPPPGRPVAERKDEPHS